MADTEKLPTGITVMGGEGIPTVVFVVGQNDPRKAADLYNKTFEYLVIGRQK